MKRLLFTFMQLFQFFVFHFHVFVLSRNVLEATPFRVKSTRSFSNECNYTPPSLLTASLTSSTSALHTIGRTNSEGSFTYVVRDTKSTRFLLLKHGVSFTIISSCFCLERESGKGFKRSNTTIGIMETSFDRNNHENMIGGVVGIGSGISTLSTCKMRSCIVDPIHLPSIIDRRIMQVINEILLSASELELGISKKNIDRNNIDGHVLMIGGGGGTLAISLLSTFSKLSLDVTEVDLTIVKLAKSHFGFASSSSGNLNVYNSEGRSFIHGSKGYYNMIIIDAVNHQTHLIPNTLITYQAIQEFIVSMNDSSGVLILHLCINKSGIGDVFKTFIELFGNGRVWYAWVKPPNHYIIVGFHLKKITSMDKSIEMSTIFLGNSMKYFQLPENNILKNAVVLCDPGKQGCAV